MIILAFCTVLLLSSVAAVGPQGRGRAKEMVCQANLSQWNTVFTDYITENDGTFFTGTNSYGYWWPVQLDEATQSWKQNRTWFCPVASRPLYNEDGTVTSGPAQNSGWGMYSHPELGPDGIAGSYGLNGYTIDLSGYRFGPRYESGIPASDGWQDFGNVPGAHNVPLFLDALRFDLWPLPTDAPAEHELAIWTSNRMARCCINRHGGAVNCLFLDGSARKLGLKELWTLKWHRSFDTAGPWTKAGGVQSSDWPEWMRDFQDY